MKYLGPKSDAANLAAQGDLPIAVSSTPPAGASEGDLWLDSDTGRLYCYFDSQWINPASVGRSVSTAAATTITGTNSEGTSNSLARADHNHALGSNVVGTAQIADGAVTNAKVAGGAITGAKLGRAIGCQATRATLSVASSGIGFTYVPFPSGDATEIYDTDNIHSLSTNTSRFVAPVAGLYLLSGGNYWALNGLGARGLELAINGTTSINQQWMTADPNFGTRLSITGVAMMAANDYAELGVFQNSGSSQSATNIRFSIHFLGTT